MYHIGRTGGKTYHVGHHDEIEKLLFELETSFAQEEKAIQWSLAFQEPSVFHAVSHLLGSARVLVLSRALRDVRRDVVAKFPVKRPLLHLFGTQTGAQISEATGVRLHPTLGWQSLPPLNHKRIAWKTASLGQDIYALGGLSTDRGSSVADPSVTRGVHHGILSIAEKYRGGTWEEIPPMIVERRAFAAVGFQGCVYAMGGFDRSNGILQSVERFDVAANAWEHVAPLLKARRAFSAVSCGDSLFALGGRDRGRLNSMERYHVSRNRWEKLPAMLFDRSAFAVCVSSEQIYILGGSAASPQAPVPQGYRPILGGSSVMEGRVDFQLSNVERFDPRVCSWEEMPSLRVGRSGIATAELCGSVYAIGGQCDGVASAVAERLDPRAYSWHNIAPLPEATRRKGLAIVESLGSLYAVSMNTCDRYDPHADRWEELQSYPEQTIAAAMSISIPEPRQ